MPAAFRKLRAKLQTEMSAHKGRNLSQKILDQELDESTQDAALEFTAPSHTEIAVAAYNLWLSRGLDAGSPEQDWLDAERQLQEA
jgi:Protein of unknown function (DUF2934)